MSDHYDILRDTQYGIYFDTNLAEVSTDCISRQEVIDALVEFTHLEWKYLKMLYPALKVLEQVPSAQPTFDARDTQYNLPIGTDCISRAAATDALRKMQTYKLFSGDDMLLIDQAGAMTELMLLPPSEPQIIRCRDCVNYKDHRCTVANHYVSEKESCAEVFGAKRR